MLRPIDESFDEQLTARADGSNVLSEYLPSIRKMIVNPNIMGRSKLKSALRFLADPSNKLRNETNYSKICSDAFQKAFGSRSPGNISVLEIGYYGNISNDISKLKERYKWETNFLCFALDVLIKEEDVQQLRTLLGLLGLGNQACEARRRMAFITVVQNAAEKLLQLNRISEGSVGNLVDPKGYLSNKCVDFIEDIKENAFRSVFLEPAMMYFDAVGDNTAYGDVDVHGSNLYLAVLQVLIKKEYHIICDKVLCYYICHRRQLELSFPECLYGKMTAKVALILPRLV